jgi:hypothetical protein
MIKYVSFQGCKDGTTYAIQHINRIKDIVLNIIKTIYGKPIANIIPNGEKLK